MAKGIGDLIYSLLSNDAPVFAIIGNDSEGNPKAYAYLAIDDVPYPYIVYTIEGIEPTQDKDGASCLDVTSFDIELYSETLSELEDLGNKVRTALERVSGTTETIVNQSISFTAEDSGYSDVDRVYLKIQSYSCRVQK